MNAQSDATPAPEFTPWAPGDNGKGVLVRGDPLRLEIWKTDELRSPHHAEGLLAFGLETATEVVYFSITVKGLEVYTAPDVDGRAPGDVIRELDPRVPPDEPVDEAWEFG